jgi:hypothetical protein
MRSRARVIDLSAQRYFSIKPKTGTPVYCPIPPVVVDALSAVEGQNPREFSYRVTHRLSAIVR